MEAHEENWAKDAAAQYNDRWHALGGGFLRSERLQLLEAWLSDRINGGEPQIYVVADWNDRPTLVLLDADGVRTVAVDDEGMIVTEYRPPCYGGSYREEWSYAEERFTLTLRFDHDALPGTLEWSFVLLRQIDQPGVPMIRALLYRWARGASSDANN
jgi:hypothetical protein